MRSTLVSGYVERAHRVAAQCRGTLVEADGYEIEVNLTNLSSKGFGLHTTAELEVGQEIHLRTHRSKPQRARIIWTRGSEAGGLFLDEVPEVS